ncbi:MAG: hypothetical protein QXN71_02745 [Candidatus Aenigmatarchaeota archaeon]
MRTGKFIAQFALLALIATILLTPASAQEKNKVKLYFFWGDGCPHCAQEKPFLEELQQKYPEVEVEMFETWHNTENAKLFVRMAEAYGTTAQGVPTTFIGDRYWVGYADYMGSEIESYVRHCIENGCQDPGERLKAHKKPVCIHAFLQSNCSQCQRTEKYLDELEEKYNISINKHDVLMAEEKELYEKFKETYGLISGAYPIVFIGNKFITGETAIKENLEGEIVYCRESGCPCPSEKIQGPTPYTPLPGDVTPEENGEITIPFFGRINPSSLSLPVFTIIIAGIDSFNPCAFFVLFFLLSMLVYAQSRKKMLLIGGTFVFFSGLIYFLFMAAWLNLFLLIGQLMLITAIAGIVALIVAGINIKDFFLFGKGVSLTIPEKAKPKIFSRMRKLLKATSIPSMMAGTIVIAIAANTYELLCTAGFPMVFTRVLTLHNLSMTDYYMYLVFYNIIYVIPLSIIVVTFTLTLGAKKLTERQGQALKLISGIMMLFLGAVLLINPALLNNVVASFGIVATALLVSWIIITFTKKSKGEGKEVENGREKAS